MRRIAWFRVVALMSVLALAGAACGGDDEEGGADGGDLPVITFQGFPADPAALPLLVMQEEGFDRENGFI